VNIINYKYHIRNQRPQITNYKEKISCKMALREITRKVRCARINTNKVE